MSDSEGLRLSVLAQAIECLREQLQFELYDPTPASHVVVVVTGLETPKAICALGVYLTGLVAGAIRVDLSLLAQLLGEGENYAEALGREVAGVVGNPQVLSLVEKETRRNPWIAECLAHAFLTVGRSECSHCVPGPVHALTLPHDKVTQQGLDLVAIYSDGGLPALCVGESKASEKYPSSHLAKAIALFRAIDDAKREYQIRQIVLGSLRDALSPEGREQLYASFWRDRRLYMPTIAYGAACSFEPHGERADTFGNLMVPVEARRLVVASLQNHHGFFDCVAEAMRYAVKAFANV